ncbi:acetate/propionate family kinase [Prosthecomicrobium sp. N25]|uniref:acetate/propionate family kinase n=1 Tax=Prosthecomicrobium sp. N25 TaxID=3129254 RepID=UPI003076E2AB
MGLCLVLNAGSSSIKFQVLEPGADGTLRRLWRGTIEGLGTAPRFSARDEAGDAAPGRAWDRAGLDHEHATLFLLDWIAGHLAGRSLQAVGHRVVHGGSDFVEAVRVDDRVMARLEALVPLAPLHQPHNLAPIRHIRAHAPELPQIVAFDTAFHHGQPEVARAFALPARITEAGVRRYGFHGLSYAYVAGRLAEVAPEIAQGRVVVAHLGSGASLCALRAGRSVASTMGFSALDGLPMGTRSGSLDPAVIFHLIRAFGMTPDEAERMLYNESGLLGVSGLSNDMRRLREAAPAHDGARRAIDLFVYRILREVGSLTAALGGLDGLVFTAGIGENDAATRAAVIEGLGWAGFRLDPDAKAAGGPRLTRSGGPSAWVIATDEECVIARETMRLAG